MRFLLIAALALAWAVPVSAQPADSGKPPSSEAITAELTAYGEWTAGLTELILSIQREFTSVGSRWRELQPAEIRGGAPAFRATLADALATSDRALAQVEALAIPDFPALELDEDVRPVTMRRNSLELLRQMRSVIESYGPLLDALVRNDAAAVRAVERRQLDSIGLLLESQVVLNRASLASTPRDEFTWNVINVQYLYFRIVSRTFSAGRNSSINRADPGLSNELVALADEAESTSRTGAERLETVLRENGDQLAQARQQGDTHNVQLLERTIAVFTLYRDLFPLGLQLASLTRQQAETFRTTAVSDQSVADFFQQVGPIRRALDAIFAAEGATMAGQR